MLEATHAHVCDLVCATCVFPLFLGIRTEDWEVGPIKIPAPTELGAMDSGWIGGGNRSGRRRARHHTAIQ